MSHLTKLLVILACLAASQAKAADWYVSSVAYTAVAQWALNHSYGASSVIRQLAAPAVNSERVFQNSGACTSNNSAEPTWNLGKGATTSDNTCTWTEITGNSGKQQVGGVVNTWTAPAARINDLFASGNAAVAAGDRVFLSSDHAETQSTTWSFNAVPGSVTLPILFLSVTRTDGNIPPIASSLTAGASITETGNAVMTFDGFHYWNGVTIYHNGNANIFLQNSGTGDAMYFKNCAFRMGSTNTSALYINNSSTPTLTWDNTTVEFDNTSATIQAQNGPDFIWKNTPSAIQGATFPTNLFTFNSGSTGYTRFLIDGVDLSAMTSGTLFHAASAAASGKVYLSNAKYNSGATLTDFATNANIATQTISLEYTNSDTGNTNYVNGKVGPTGTMSTSSTTTRVGGATDGTTPISWKFVTTADVNPWVKPFDGFPIVVWNTLTSGSHTVTASLVSSSTLNVNDFAMACDTLSSSSPVSTWADTGLVYTPLSTNSALTTDSSSTWNSPPSTPNYYTVSITFSPVTAGLIKCVPRLQKASTTVYFDPLLTVN